MSSRKSSSSKDLFDPAMLDDDLDYEPDGESITDERINELLDYDENDVLPENPIYSGKGKKQYLNGQMNGYFNDQDSRDQLPEPSGQEDQESINTSSGRKSLGADSGKCISVAGSFRDKINYNKLHLNVEKDSCRSKFGKYSTLGDSCYLDSSDEEEAEFSDTENQNVQESEVDEQTCHSDSPEHPPLPDQNYSYPQSPDEYASTDEMYENYEDERSGTTTVEADPSEDEPLLQHEIPKNIGAPASVPKKKPFNFSIQVTGSARVFLAPSVAIKKKRQKPWLCKVKDYLKKSKLLRLNSSDEVLQCPPDTIEPSEPSSGIKSRLGGSSTGSQLSGSGTSPSVFKVPLKRPPTRQKTPSKNISISVDITKGQKTVLPGNVSMSPVSRSTRISQEEPADDIISLIASSCRLSTDDTEEDLNLQNNLQVKSEPFSLSGSLTGTERARAQRTAQWVTNALEPRTHSASVPEIYKGLCFHYFFNNNCTNKMCRLSHFLDGPKTRIRDLKYLSEAELDEAYNYALGNPHFYGQIYKYFAEAFAQNAICRNDPKTRIRDLKYLSEAELDEAYNYALGNPHFYGQIYKYFAEAFAQNDMKNKLIQMVHIIFDESSHKINQQEGLTVVINALQETDLETFEDTVEYLLMQIGLKRHPELGIVLLGVISTKPSLPQYWPVIKKLIISGEKMNEKLGSKYLVHLMKPPVNLKVCQDMYQHILKYKCIDLPKIAPAIREPFLKICSQEKNNLRVIQKKIEQNLSKERFNFENRALQQANFPTQDATALAHTLPFPQDFSVPPPNFMNLGAAPHPARIGPPMNFMPRTEFGSNASHETDFASLRRQENSFAPQAKGYETTAPVFSAPHRNYGNVQGGGSASSSQCSGSQHDLSLIRYRPSDAREGRNSYGSSEDEESPMAARRSDSDSSSFEQISPSPYFKPNFTSLSKQKRPAPTDLMYNKEGLQYDPANDYVPPPKRRAPEPLQYDPANDNTPPSKRRAPDDLRLPRLDRVGLNQLTPPISEFDRLRQGSDWMQEDGFNNAAQRPYDVTEGQAVQSANEGYRTGRPNNRGQGAGRRGTPTVKRPEMRGSGTNVNARSKEGAVSSSSDAMLRDSKPPEHPQFGKLYFDPNYEFNVSLHNLYLQAIDNVDIDEEDVHRLNDCVKTADGKTFLKLVEKYRGPQTVQNFISMTLAHLKGMNQLVAKTYQMLLEKIEKVNPNYYGNLNVRVVLEVITMNLLFQLHQRCMWTEACGFLKRFSNWDSLVTSRLFINGIDKSVSIVGRYLFIAETLTFTKPELTYEILVCPNLHLLERYENWPYHPPCPIPEIFNADLEFRNNVIKQFLRTGYRRNMVAVIQLYKTALRKKIWNFEYVTPFIEPMVVDLLNLKQVAFLKLVSTEIDMFYKHMEKDTLRAFIILMYEHLGQSDLYTLYEKCVARNIYQKLLTGDILEYTIEIKTNMDFSEMELVVKYYFSKLAIIKKVPSQSETLKFEIKLPGEYYSKTWPILNINKSIQETKEELEYILKSHYDVQCKSVMPTILEIEKTELIKYLENIWT